MPHVLRSPFVQPLRQDAAIGVSQLCTYKDYAIFFDGNDGCLKSFRLKDVVKDQLGGDEKQTTFVDFQLNADIILQDVYNVFGLSVYGDYMIVQHEERTEVYKISIEKDRILLSLFKKYNKLNDREPARALIANEKLIQLFYMSNDIQLVDLQTDEQKELHINQFKTQDIIVTKDNQVYVITCSSIIKLNLDDMERSQQFKLQVSGQLQTVAGLTTKDELILLTSERQLVAISLQTYKIIFTIQKVSKSETVFAKFKNGKSISLITESNEVLDLDITKKGEQKPQSKQQQITQVKCDFYNTLFRTDSVLYGFDVSDGISGVGMSCKAIYIW